MVGNGITDQSQEGILLRNGDIKEIIKYLNDQLHSQTMFPNVKVLILGQEVLFSFFF